MSNNTSIHPMADVQSSHVGAGTRIWQYVVVLPEARIGSDCNICSHCFIENCADFRSVSRSCNGRPSCFLRNEENILAQILITIFFKAFSLCNKLVIFPFKCAGNIAKENQSDDYLSIFSGRDMSP